MAQLKGHVVACINQHDNADNADSIGRYFMNGDRKYIRLDILPILNHWKHEAFVIPVERWSNGGDLPVLESDSPITHTGNLSIICEEWTPSERGKKQRISRKIGTAHNVFTQYGSATLLRFHAIPANPYYFSNNGTITLFDLH